MKNETVVENWINGKIGESLHMSTDGKSIFSYSMKIGQTLSNGFKQVLNVQKPYFYSMTTSKHVGIAKGYCSRIVNPVPIHSYLYGGAWYVFP